VRLAIPLLLTLAACKPTAQSLLDPIDTRVQVDAGADLLPSLCSIANVALCDGFEGDVLAYPPWLVVAHAGAVDIDRLRAYRGLRSIRFHTDPMPDTVEPRRHTELTEVDTIPPSLVALRFFVYLPSPTPVAGWRLASMLDRADPNVGAMLFVTPEGRFDLVGAAGDEHLSSTTLPLDRWACLEWRLTRGPTGGSRLFLDGQEIPDLTLTNTRVEPPAGVGLLGVGLAFFGNANLQPAYDLWVDELIVDPAPIGCSR